MAFQNTNFVTTLATAGTTLLSLSFVFAVSVQEFLGSCIFLFVKHPYDVGDRVDIVGPSGNECLVVEQISLLYTVFKRIDNMKVVQVPNIVLNTVWVENVTRSKAMKEQLEMFISFDTSLEDIDLLRAEMESFVRHPDNSRDFQPDLLLEATGIGNMDKLQLRVEIRHKSNWHNETVRAARRSKFMCALVLALRKVPIYAPGGGYEPLGGATNPGYSVTVDDTFAATARENAKKDKEGKRLVPTPPKDDSKSPSHGGEHQSHEAAAAAALNARAPGVDAAHKDGDDNRGSDGTLHDGREDSPERNRGLEIDNLRDGLMKRHSTRGRRRPGEVVASPTTSQHAPGLSLTQSSPRRETGFSSSRVHGEPLDEEAEVGGYDTGRSGEGLYGNVGQTAYGQGQSGQRTMDAYGNFSNVTQQQAQQGSSRQPMQGFSNIPLGGNPSQQQGPPPARR